jgi:hypothetical protein
MNKSQKEANRTHRARPDVKYKLQERQAAKRGIAWLFTFETWWEVWRKSGKWHERGSKSGQYVMCRKGDIGPYSPENVFIATTRRNAVDVSLNKGRRTHLIAWHGYIN